MKQNLIIRASAGTGKTFALATRFLRLMCFENVPAERIVALTFSRNAAQEIYVKILERLWKASLCETAAEKEMEENLLEGFSDAGKENARKVFRGSKEDFLRCLREVIDVQDAGSIATIDSFIMRLVRGFPLETGFQGAPGVLVEQDESLAREEARNALLAMPADQDREVARLFSAARGGATSRTVGKPFGKDVSPWIGFLAAHPEADKWDADSMRAKLGNSVEELSDAIEEAAAKLRLAVLVREEYKAAVRRSGTIAFSDFTEALAETGELELLDLQFRLDSKFDHWELDEFQDTSEAQWKCLRRLVEEAAQPGPGRSAMVVGDLKQSIYTWRGGNDAPFNELMGWPQFDGENGEKTNLPESHRYGKRTVDFINAVFGPDNIRSLESECREAVKLWLGGNCWMTHLPPRNQDGAIRDDDYVAIVAVSPEAAGVDAGTDEDALDADGKPSAAVKAMSTALCGFVKEIWARHEAVESRETIGILVRKNGDGALLAEKLLALGIPVAWEGRTSLSESPVVRAVLNLLSLSRHPQDMFAWRTVNDIFPLRKFVFPEILDAAGVSAEVSRWLSRLGLGRTLRRIVERIPSSSLDDRTRMALESLVREGAAFEGRPDGGDLARFRECVMAASSRDVSDSPRFVRILTIHRAKGLSLDHAIVPVPESKSSTAVTMPDARRTILCGDGWAVAGFAGKSKEDVRASIPELAAAWKRAANEQLLETLRTWYVALTRAKKSTYVFVLDRGMEKQAAGNAEPPAVQFRDLLCAPWKDAFAEKSSNWGRIVFEDGDEPSFGPGKGPGAANLQERWGHDAADHVQSIRHRTPSSPASTAESDDAIAAEWFFTDSFGTAAKKGVDEHAAFAEIKWIGKTTEDERERKILECDVAWRKAFLETPGATVWREKSYELFDPGRNVWETGQFDRVVFRVEDGIRTAEIYDFKTNANHEKSVAQFEEKMRETYAGQMTAYRAALSRITGIDSGSITATLLLTSTGTAVKI